MLPLLGTTHEQLLETLRFKRRRMHIAQKIKMHPRLLIGVKTRVQNQVDSGASPISLICPALKITQNRGKGCGRNTDPRSAIVRRG